MGAVRDIVRVVEGLTHHHRLYGTLTGAVLWMRDGSKWFHPYKGGAPICMEKSD